MAFENDTNLGRVQKMIETLQLIVKSAQSNRADDDAIRDLLRPLTDELAALGANSPPARHGTMQRPTERIVDRQNPSMGQCSRYGRAS